MADRTIVRGSTGVILQIPPGPGKTPGWFEDAINFGAGDPPPDETNTNGLVVRVIAVGDTAFTNYDGAHQKSIAALGTYVAPPSGMVRVGATGCGLEVHLEDLWFAKAGSEFTIAVSDAGNGEYITYTVALDPIPAALSGEQDLTNLVINAQGTGRPAISIQSDDNKPGIKVIGAVDGDAIWLIVNGAGFPIKLDNGNGSQPSSIDFGSGVTVNFTGYGDVTGGVTGTPAVDSIDVEIDIDRADGFFDRCWLGITSGDGNAQWRRITAHTRTSSTVATFTFGGGPDDPDAPLAVAPASSDSVRITGRG